MVGRGGSFDTDVFVAGGGPAGLAVAIAAARRGLSVILADHGSPPIDKACGEGLMPNGVDALEDIGVELDAADGRPFRGITFIDGDIRAEAAFRMRHGLGIERVALHRVLAQRAQGLGVVTHWRTRVQALSSSVLSAGAVVSVGATTLRCRWAIAADGAQSRIRRSLGIRPNHAGRARIGSGQHFRVEPWSDLVEVYWRRGIQAYVTPVRSDVVCVALLADFPVRGLADIRRHFPELADRIRDAEPLGPQRGGVSVSRTYPRVTAGNVALVGDASGSVDAVAGEGLSLAFAQAAALGRALEAGELSAYEQAHRRLRRVPVLAASVLVGMGRHDLPRRLALRHLAADPRFFDALLRLHIGRVRKFGPAGEVHHGAMVRSDAYPAGRVGDFTHRSWENG